MSSFYPSSSTATANARRASAHERAMAIIAGGNQFNRLKAVETTVKHAPQVVIAERDQRKEFETRAGAASTVFGARRHHRARDSRSAHHALMADIARGQHQLNHVREPQVSTDCVVVERKQDQKARFAAQQDEADACLMRTLCLRASAMTGPGRGYGVVVDSQHSAPKASAHRRAMELIRRAGAEGSVQHGLNHVETKVHRGVVLDSRQTASCSTRRTAWRDPSAYRSTMALIEARAESPQHGLNHVQTRVYAAHTPVVIESRVAQEADFRQRQKARAPHQGSSSKASAHRRAMELIAGLDSREYLKPVQTREYAAGEPVVVVKSAEQKRAFAHAQRAAASKELLRSLESEVARLQLNHVNPRVSRVPVVGVLPRTWRAEDNNNLYRKAGRGWILARSSFRVG